MGSSQLKTAMRLPTAGTRLATVPVVAPCDPPRSCLTPCPSPAGDRAFDAMGPPVFQILSFRGPERQSVLGTAEIDPGSSDPIRLPRREDLDTKDQKIFDYFTSGSKAVLRGLHGPAGIWLHEPKLAEVWFSCGNCLRFDAGLFERVRELGVLGDGPRMRQCVRVGGA